MKYISTVLLTLLITNTFSQERKIHGAIDSIHSTILNEQRKIYVYTPTRHSINGVSKSVTYPVIYLLDPEMHFNTIAAMLEELSGEGSLPEMIIIGIANTDRTRDLTPSHVDKEFYHDKFIGWGLEAMKTSGGGENFTTFLSKELMPYVETHYPVSPYRIFIGHSFGGLLVTNTILRHPDLFNAYITLDPSLWWDDGKLYKQIQKDFPSKNLKDKILYMAVANTAPTFANVAQVRKDTVPSTLLLRTNLELNELLRRNTQTKLRYDGKYYPKDSHGSVPLIGTYDGLRFIYDYYKLNLPFDKNTVARTNIDSLITAHFNKVSKEMGYTVLPPLLLLNDYGYFLLQTKRLEKCRQLFQRNLENYPTSVYVYDAMGDYYKETGDKKKAIEYYKKALTFFEYPETKMKLEKLLEN